MLALRFSKKPGKVGQKIPFKHLSDILALNTLRILKNVLKNLFF